MSEEKGWHQIWSITDRTLYHTTAELNVFIDDLGRVRNGELILRKQGFKRTNSVHLTMKPEQLLAFKNALVLLDKWGEAL